MSGICGLIDFGGGLGGDALMRLMMNMQKAMIHRGFERDCIWMDANRQVAISDCHLLTSTTSLMANSNAPIHMVCDCDDFTLTEAPTSQDARGAHPLQTLATVFSDSTKSPVEALRNIETPFAVALWNDRLKKLLLARDAFNAKPLYFANGRGWFAFASELRALKTIPEFDATINPFCIGEYLHVGGAQSTNTFFNGARRVDSGCFMQLDCAPLFASASLLSIRESDRAASGIATRLAPMCGDLVCAHFYNKSPQESPLLHNISLVEQSELLRRALLESLQQGQHNVAATHFMQINGAPDFLLATMNRLELGRTTHMLEISPLNHLGTPTLSDTIAQHIGAQYEGGAQLDDMMELLNRIVISFDEPVASADAISLYTNAAFARMHCSQAVSALGAIECDTDTFEQQNLIPLSVGGLLGAAAQKFSQVRNIFSKTQIDTSNAPLQSGHNSSLWSREDLRAAGFLRAREATSHAQLPDMMIDLPANGHSSSETMPVAPLILGAIAMLNQMCMHHSLAVRTPFLNCRATQCGGNFLAPQALQANKFVFIHLLRTYLPESLIAQIMRHEKTRVAPISQKALAPVCESLLFASDSRVLALTNRIALRGLLTCPTTNARQLIDRCWSLLVLELWLRRH